MQYDELFLWTTKQSLKCVQGRETISISFSDSEDWSFQSLAQRNAVVQPALTTQNTTENNCFISHVENATVLPPNEILNGTHQ